jgi:hypothetical protein
VPVELWERVQDVIDGRFSNNIKRGRRDFAFSGLISCKKCGCAVVGEIKKGRYGQKFSTLLKMLGAGL